MVDNNPINLNQNTFNAFKHLNSYIDLHNSALSTFMAYDPSKTARDKLPIYKHLSEIAETIDNNNIAFIIGETGSGKSSQLPQILNSLGFNQNGFKTIISQHNKIEVIQTAYRVAEELQVNTGQEVGFITESDTMTSPSTIIEFADHISLLDQIRIEPALDSCSVVIIEDIEHRTIRCELLLFLVKKIAKYRKDKIKIVLTFNYPDIQRYVDYFRDDTTSGSLELGIAEIPPKQREVKICYTTRPIDNVLEFITDLIIDLHNKYESKKGVWVFMPDKWSMNELEKRLNTVCEYNAVKSLKIQKLIKQMKLKDQITLFEPLQENERRIILTNVIYEPRVCIEHMYFVIDTMMAKAFYYDQHSNIGSYKIVYTTKDVAHRRATKISTCNDGYCYRLCTKEDFEKLPDYFISEMITNRIDELLLYVLSMNLNIASINFLAPVSELKLLRALESLYSLKLIDEHGQLTDDKGKKVIHFPLDYKLATLLLNSLSPAYNCSEEIIVLVSILNSGDLFLGIKESGPIIRTKKSLGAKEGDLISYINIYNSYFNTKSAERRAFCNEYGLNEKTILNASKLKEKIANVIHDMGFDIKSCEGNVEIVIRCIISVFFLNLAQRSKDDSYKVLGESDDKIFKLHPESILNTNYPSWVLFYETVSYGHTNETYLNHLVEIKINWVKSDVPELIKDERLEQYEEKRKNELTVNESHNVRPVPKRVPLEKRMNKSRNKIISTIASDDEF